MACPNTTHPAWKALVSEFGEFEAYRDFAENNESIRSVDEVRQKLIDEGKIVSQKPVSDTQIEVSQLEGESPYGESWVREMTLDQDNTHSREVVSKMMDRLSNQLGVQYQVVSQKEAVELTRGKRNPYSGQKAFFMDGRVYFVGDMLSESDVLHEFSHPLVRAISFQNPELFESLFNQLSETIEGRELIEEAKRETEGLPENMMKEEAIVKALSRYTKESSGGLNSFIQELLFAIRQLLRGLFGAKVSVENLDENTTLAQLAEMLQRGDRFSLESTPMTEENVVAYLSSQREFIDDMDKLDNTTIQDSINLFHDMIQKQIKSMRENKNYKGLAEILSEEFTKQGILQEINANLSRYETRINNTADRVLKDNEDSRAHSAAFVESLQRLQKAIAIVTEGIKTMSKNTDNVENLYQARYYNDVLDYWGKFADELEKSLKESDLDPNSPVAELVSSIQRGIKSAEKFTSRINEEGVLDVLWEQLLPMVTQIDAKYKDLIEHAEKTKQDWIKAKYENEYEKIKLTREKLRDTLKGKLGDAHYLNSFLEGYMYNQDPVINSFAAFVKSGVTEALQNAQFKYNDFARDMQPLLEKLGYSPSNIGKLGQQVSFTDRKGGFETVDGKIVFKEKLVHSFLSPHKDYRFVIQKFDFEIEQAKTENHKNPSEENRKKIELLQSQKRRHMRTHFHQEFVPSFYERDTLFDDELGQRAYGERKKILDEMSALQDTVRGDLDPHEKELDILAELQLLQAKYRKLHSEYDEDGVKKQGEDLAIALRLKEYREATRPFFEDYQRKGVFENGLKHFEQNMLNKGFVKGAVGTPERVAWDAERKRWLDANTRVKIKPEFYQKRNEIFDTIARILSVLPDKAKKDNDISAVWAEILDIVSPNRDDDGQPVGTEVNENRTAKVKLLQESLKRIQENYMSMSGLTPEEQAFRKQYYATPKDQLLEADIIKMKEIKAKSKTGPISSMMMDELNKAFEDLADLQGKEATDYYIEAVNRKLTDENREHLKKKFNITEFTRDTIDLFSDETALRTSNPNLAEWFDKNHIQREKYDSVKKETVTLHERLYIWNIVRPNDTAYYETTSIVNEDGNIEEIPGIPTMKYFNRRVKSEFHTRNQSYHGIGTTIDNMGNQLPLLSEHGGTEGKQSVTMGETPVEFEYINQEYYKVQRENPALFAVLEKLKEHHLENQTSLARNAKLYMDIPRYEKGNLETLQTPGGIIATFQQIIKAIRDFFMRTKYDYERGHNFQDEIQMVNTDMWDAEQTGIPITGLYDIELDRVSLDVTNSMMRYMLSAEKHKVLRKMNPVAKALKTIVNDSENAINEIGKASRRDWTLRQVITPTKKKGLSVRANAINNLYEREFQGVNLKGFGSNSKAVQAISSIILGRASFSFFALNIPSALKNALGAQYQTMLESISGKYITPTNLLKGESWATKAMFRTSAEIYNKGNKSLDVQLAEIFDPAQGRFQDKFGESMSRTGVKDIAGTSWMYNTRQWTQLHATYNLFGGMMYTKLIPQTINGVTRMIPYMEAWEIGNGQIRLKQGIDPEYSNRKADHLLTEGETLDSIASQYGITVEQLKERNPNINLDELEPGTQLSIGKAREFTSFRNTVQRVDVGLNGAYGAFDQPEASRYLLFRAITFLKRYFTPMLMTRWAFRGKAWAPHARYDIAMSDISEGYYITAFNSIIKLFGSRFKYLPFMQKNEKRAFLRAGVEMGLLVVLSSVILPLFFGWDDDDEDRYEKMRKRSGALPTPFSHDSDDAWKAGGWLMNHALLLGMQFRNENEAFIPLPGFGLDDYYKVTEINSIATGPTVKLWGQLIDDVNNMINPLWGNPDKAFYQREVGSYSWQDAGGSKFLAHAFKSIGMTGSTLDPVTATRNLVSMKATGK